MIKIINQMKHNWEIKKLGELYSFKNGINFDKTQKNKKGILTIDVLNMYTEDLYPDLSNLYEVDIKVSNDYLLQNNDILFVRSSVKKEGVGWTTIYKEIEKNVTFCGFIIRARVIDKNKIYPEYVVNYMRNPQIREEIIKKATQSTITNINQTSLSEIQIPLPPLPEQKRIVVVLDEAFDAIAKAKENAEKNLANAKELFKSYLNGVFEKRGEGWGEKRLGECFKLKSGDNITSKMMNKNGKYPVYGGNGIAGMYNEFNLSGSNIIIGRVGALCGNVRHIKENIWLTDNAFKISDYKYVFDHAFLAYLLNLRNLRSYARQAAQPVISNSSLEDVLLQFPKSIEEQKSIVAKLDSLSAETKRLEEIYRQKVNDLEELKKSVLNKAFNGEL